MSEAFQVVTTTATRADAEKIARALVEERLAACVQVSGPLTSCYRWQGRIETAEEWLCTIKTRAALYPAVEQAIRRAHPYTEPEILATPIAAGSPSYLAWLDQETASADVRSEGDREAGLDRNVTQAASLHSGGDPMN